MFLFLIVALFSQSLNLSDQKPFRPFLPVYHVGLPLSVLMMLIRGMTEVLNAPMSKGLDGALSGIAGLGHILMGLGLILLLTTLVKADRNKAFAV